MNDATTLTKSSTFRDKVQQLSAAIEERESSVKSKDSQSYLLYAVGGLSPFAILAALYYGEPSFVMKKDGEKSIVDTKLLLAYTLGFSALVWGGLYVYSRYSTDSTTVEK